VSLVEANLVVIEGIVQQGQLCGGCVIEDGNKEC
jgi:hypothetical protein